MTPELKDAIQKSGNNLHLKVVEYLQNANWTVDISAYYLDDTTNKPREIDIIAQKKIYLKNINSSHPQDFSVLLFIECKHLSGEIVFWTQDRSNELIFKRKGLAKFSGNIKEENISSGHHYFLPPSVGKLYTTVGKDEVFDGITQPVKALTSFMDYERSSGLYYPICIYEGTPELHLIKSGADIKNLDKLETVKNLIVELNYSWRKMAGQPTKEYFAIDLTHIDELAKLIDIIDREAENTRSSICNFLNSLESKKHFPESY